MKKVFLFATAAIAALAMFSCNKEIETLDQKADGLCPEGYYVEELTAVYPTQPETRTAFNETTGKFAWTEGDELAFHLSNGEYTSAPIDPATSKVKLYLPVGVTRDNFAVYPASAVVDGAAEHGNMKVTLPDTYDISGNLQTDFVETPLIAINDADNKHLKFEHAGALLQFNLNVPAGVKTANVSLGKTITGEFTLDEDASGNGAIEAGTATDDDFVTFILSNEDTGLSEASAVKLLTPLPTGTYNNVKIAYDNGFEFSKELSTGWTFDRSGGKKVSISEDKFEDNTDYFWFEALDAGSTVTFTERYPVTLYISLDGKQTWSEWDKSTITFENAGDRVYFYGNNEAFNQTTPFKSYNGFDGTGRLKVGGSLMSLLKKSGGVMSDCGFAHLFIRNKAIVDASELVMPDYTTTFCFGDMFFYCENLTATPVFAYETVSPQCFYKMFEGCSSLEVFSGSLPAMAVEQGSYSAMFAYTKLKNAPELPATQIAPVCYSTMFQGCDELLTAPSELPSADVPDGAYSAMFQNCAKLVNPPAMSPVSIGIEGCWGMFQGCSKLVKAPMLNATQIATGCYQQMFYGCSSLVDVSPDILPATTLAERCYCRMFQDCTSLNVAINLPAEVMAPSCYTGFYARCSSLENAPTYIGTTVAESCYSEMFMGCKKLTTVATNLLPATTLQNLCYNKMFRGCSALIAAPDLPAETLVSKCYYEMFYSCTSLAYVKVGFTDWATDLSATYGWLCYERTTSFPYYWCNVNTKSSSKFYKPEELSANRNPTNKSTSQAQESEYSFIPYGWTIYNLDEVGGSI